MVAIVANANRFLVINFDFFITLPFFNGSVIISLIYIINISIRN